MLGASACAERSERVALEAPPPLKKAAPSSACPDEMALVGTQGASVCVDRYEAALEGRRFSQPVDGVDGGALVAASAKGKMPQVNISEPEAEAACESASKRLCTATEWRAACQGPTGLTYPYGNDFDPGACNVGKPRPSGAAQEKLDDPRLAEAPGGIAPGGSFARCVSATGVYDMHGNVHEWVSDASHPDDPRYGEFLGGYFADGVENGAGCTYATKAHFKDYHDYSTGFRCCKDAR